ncbi:hypothetical protein CABS01_08393 [Colletotrichum abscissum]|uniref:Uncharacterized protein n=1 Tax=Colletotrichum abscissum TaxID=1671311 RepID=A0A9P9XDY8_9PEZI|nr:uncharacterized protein CABS01_08393 [Colletotrichum abscissum]KAI3549188.1 hypothetical protein CABS02_08016 [Colletotrichum abscissum]KAK1507213.1 hypothetical protein CABS01_08393 [Colletotrichum abscissum]
MSTDPSDCPQDSNSTDCLLRAVAEILNESRNADGAKFDWEPWNFGITVFIGAVALVFALIPIIQVIIAPGQGSRTSSRLAIGPYWSEKTTRKWNPRQWVFEYTVTTPIFRMKTLKKWIKENIEEENEGHEDYKHDLWSDIDKVCPESIDNSEPEKLTMNKACRTVNDKRDTGKKPIDLRAALVESLRAFLAKRLLHFRRENRPAATWIEFFQKTGLDEIIPKPKPQDQQSQGTEPQDPLGERDVTADYLPSDMVAAPAYAQIGVIVTAAATTRGWVKWPDDPSSKYPVILGHGFQFDFRQHPILGTIGAYSQYSRKSQDRIDPDQALDTLLPQWLRSTIQDQEAHLKIEKRRRLRLDSLNELRVAILHARGSIEAREQSLFRGGSKDKNPLKAINLKGSEQRTEALRFLLEVSKKDMDSGARDAFMLDYGELSHDQYMPIVALFLASTPQFIPAIFPTNSLRKMPPLTILALSGHYWTEVSKEAVRGDDLSDWPKSLQTPRWDTNAIQWVNDGMDDVGKVKSETLHETFKKIKQSIYNSWNCQGGNGSNPTVGLKVVLHLCLKLLHNADTFRSWFDEYHPAVGAYLRRLILLQLQLLDLWFMDDKHTTSSTESRAIRICNTTLVLMLAEDMASRQGDVVHPTPDESKQTVFRLNLRTLKWLENLMKPIDLPEEIPARYRNDWNPQKSFDRKSLSIKSVQNQEQDDHEILESLAAQMKPYDKDLRHLACDHYNKKWELFNTCRMLNRLDKVVSSKADSAYRKRLPRECQVEESVDDKTTDDIIIFRCILISLLFQMAPDNSKLLDSGIWEQVVGIL